MRIMKRSTRLGGLLAAATLVFAAAACGDDDADTADEATEATEAGRRDGGIRDGRRHGGAGRTVRRR